jgi:hypothetical protein
MEIWVGGMRVWRLERPGGPINVIGGSDGNEVTAGVFSATISGGGANTGNPTLINRVTDALGTVSGGSGNRAGDGDGDVGNAQSANVSG